MGWETRGNYQYYYRKRWVDGRAVSEYVGADFLGTAAYALDGIERYERQAAAAEWRAVVESERIAECELCEIERLTRAITAAVLIANGYHTHRRQWRRERR